MLLIYSSTWLTILRGVVCHSLKVVDVGASGVQVQYQLAPRIPGKSLEPHPRSLRVLEKYPLVIL